jgi:hypothetical protein
MISRRGSTLGVKKMCKCDLRFVSMVNESLSSTKICVNHTNLCKLTQIFTPGGEKMCICVNAICTKVFSVCSSICLGIVP